MLIILFTLALLLTKTVIMKTYTETQLKRKNKPELCEILSSLGIDGSFSNKGLINKIIELQNK